MNALMDYAKNTYANDPRFKIAYACGRGWDVFDHEGDLRNIPSRLNNSSLVQTQVSDVAPLQHLKQLAKLKAIDFAYLDNRENSLDRRPRLSPPKVEQLCKLKGKQLTYTDSAATAQRWRAEGLGVKLHFK